MLQPGWLCVRFPLRYFFFFFNLPNPSSHTMGLGLTKPQTAVSTRNLPVPALKADNITNRWVTGFRNRVLYYRALIRQSQILLVWTVRLKFRRNYLKWNTLILLYRCLQMKVAEFVRKITPWPESASELYRPSDRRCFENRQMVYFRCYWSPACYRSSNSYLNFRLTYGPPLGCINGARIEVCWFHKLN
jgi:hypothetical protein